jgi:hypothetical protein
MICGIAERVSADEAQQNQKTSDEVHVVLAKVRSRVHRREFSVLITIAGDESPCTRKGPRSRLRTRVSERLNASLGSP